MQTSQQKNSASSVHGNSTPESKLLKVEREYKVPIERLFAAFESSEAIKAWWWPKGLHADRVEYDFRKGGHYFINMKGYDKGGGGMTGDFEEIVKNERIVMTDNFADENGKAISAAEAKAKGDWPAVVYITFAFSTEAEGKSRVSLSQEGIPNEMQKDCIQGWTEMFDKLELYLKNQKQ